MPGARQWIALLGRRDIPADGVEDYCIFLGRALAPHNVELKLVRVNWNECGWLSALRQLSRDCMEWRGGWVLLQYTALAWSRRGFPVGAWVALEVLRRRGVRCAVIFHEPGRQTGNARLLQRVRGACQDWVARRLYRGAAKSIFADRLEAIPWLPQGGPKAAFVPIGANIPAPPPSAEYGARGNGAQKTVAVFCLSDAPNVHREVGDISYAMRSLAAKDVKLRLVLLGRGTAEAKDEIARAFEGVPVEVVNLGLLGAQEISRTLSESDAMLCVRGKLFPRRGSALAGIACGLPIIAYEGAMDIFPVGEAGVRLVPYGDRHALADALAQVLLDSGLHERLRARSLRAYEQYFSWDVIAGEMVRALQEGPSNA
ncbi:MAG: glycosyltransferase family 4 protein [Candidatus Acidiferrales bacterium]